MSTNLAIFTKHPNLTDQAASLSEQLQLPLAQTHSTEYEYLLILTPHYLGLVSTQEKTRPVYIDFLSGKLTYRREQTSLRNEALARALGLKHDATPTLIDATAGLAQDSFMLAGLGFEVTLLERSPIICELLKDGILRAAENPHVAPIIERLTLIETDAIDWLKAHSADLVYLDPMFPSRDKSAAVKKEMRVFHDIIGEDLDADALLQAALTCATQRVVVKRPRLAKPIEGVIEPSYSIKGSSCRFDVYILHLSL